MRHDELTNAALLRLWGTLYRKYVDVDDDDGGNTIKLGLGDFVFYSVLVSKSALFDFTAMAATLIVVLLVRVHLIRVATFPLYRLTLPF